MITLSSYAVAMIAAFVFLMAAVLTDSRLNRRQRTAILLICALGADIALRIAKSSI